MSRLLAAVLKPFDSRFELTDRLHRAVLDRPVPQHARRFWFCFGGLAAFVFAMQVASGIFLTMYYQPTPDRAYASVFYVSHYVNYGWLIRSTHVWGAHLMMALIFAHMLRVFLTASYKHPREFNWVAGVFLFVVTMGFGLTGALLPWDQKAYWGSTVTISLVKQMPVIGPTIAGVVTGGDSIGAATLTRFYSGHVFLLPAALAVLLVMHLWMIRKQGVSGPL